MRLTSLIAVLVIAGPAFAQDTTTPAPEEKKICRRMEPTTGSLMGGKRVCHTKAEWARIDEQNQANADRALDKRRSQGLGRGT